jgi:hypothetical protein
MEKPKWTQAEELTAFDLREDLLYTRKQTRRWGMGLCAFDSPDVITNYAGWLDKEKRLSNRAYFVIYKEGIVRFKKIMEKSREILPVPELEKALEGL